jgi:SulP family sulfate permease
MSETRSGLSGDFWGGLAATLVALPSAIAFGVAIYSPLGATYSSQGAVAGILGTIALGVVAAMFGGAKRLITAPCAPAAAVLSALALELTTKGVAADSAILMLTLVGLGCGAVQLLLGGIGAGRLIKYMPYPVVSGYLTAVGLLIVSSQAPRWLGTPKSMGFWQALGSPSAWHWQGIVIGLVTIGVMLLAPRITRAVPAPVLALSAGVLTFFSLGWLDRSLLDAHNPLLIGPLGASASAVLPAMVSRWKTINQLTGENYRMIISAALSLAVLLSIDTLKTCLVVDTVTRSRHNSNRELTGQGFGNLAAAFAGGVPGSGTLGATMVNVTAGAATQRSGIFCGLLALAIFVALGPLVAWLPIPALAGILMVVGVRMCHFDTLKLARSRSTLLDLCVIVAVVVVALKVELIAASAVGVLLAILLFVREQIGGSVVRNKAYGNQMFSRSVRVPEEMAILEEHGDRCVIFELQGSLFFGTTDQLYSAIEPELQARDHVILDMRHVKSVDFTAAHSLEQIGDTLGEHGAELIFSHFPARGPSGNDVEAYLGHVGLEKPEHHVRIFEHLDEALEYVEDKILTGSGARWAEQAFELRDIALFHGRKEETLAALEECIEKRSYTAGQPVFSRGETGDEIFFIRRGSVRIVMPLSSGQSHHLATFGRGDFFGEMAFLDQGARSADAVAASNTDLFVLSRRRFDTLASLHKRLGMNMLDGVARTLALRLRSANVEVRALHEG